MAKVFRALLAGVFLAVAVFALAVPFTHSYDVPPGCCPSSAIWGGEEGTEPPPWPPQPTSYPVDCGPALSGGPDEFTLHSFYFFVEPCAEPIRTRRIVGVVSLLCGASIVVASIVIDRRSTRREQALAPDSTDSTDSAEV